ncbi:hypothetical protein Gotri_014800, partial [Gossypium trilobum]|nr:hypothetical protein [Gossypium trilobum]
VWLPDDLIQPIVGFPPRHPFEGFDRLSWHHTSTGAFSIKSAYKMMNVSWNSRDETLKKVWKFLGPQGVRFFLLTILKQRLLTNAERVRRGLAVDHSCQSVDMVQRIYCILLEIAQQLRKSRNRSYQEQLTRGWTFLNTDSAVQMESGDATVRRIMCGEKGDWVFGYNQFIGKCSIFYAKLWGILDGLKLIQRRDHDKVIIESDYLEVIKAIHRSVSKTSKSIMIRRIHQILSQEGQWILHHILKEHNQSADHLAKLAFAKKKEDLQLIDIPPKEVLEFLEADKERSIRIP